MKTKVKLFLHYLKKEFWNLPTFVMVLVAFAAGGTMQFSRIMDRDHKVTTERKLFISVHTTNNPWEWGTGKNNAEYLSRAKNAGAQYVIDDIDTYITAEDNWSIPSVGGKRWKGFTPKPWLVDENGKMKVTNANSISFEMCFGWGRNNDTIVEKTAAYIGWQLVNKGLDIGSVVRHHEVVGKYCPFFGQLNLTTSEWLKFYKDPTGSGFWDQAYEDRHFFRFKKLVAHYRDIKILEKALRMGRMTQVQYDAAINLLCSKKPKFFFEPRIKTQSI